MEVQNATESQNAEGGTKTGRDKIQNNKYVFSWSEYLFVMLLSVCRVSVVLWSCRRKIFTVKKQIKNILAPHLEQNISLPFSFPFPVKYCEIIQAGVSKLILKRLHTPLLCQKLIMSMILTLLSYLFLEKLYQMYISIPKH